MINQLMRRALQSFRKRCVCGIKTLSMSLSFRLTLFLVWSSYTSTVINADNVDSMVCPEALPAASGSLSLVVFSLGSILSSG